MKSGIAAVVFRVGGLLGLYPQNQALGVEFSALIGQRNILPVSTSGQWGFWKPCESSVMHSFLMSLSRASVKYVIKRQVVKILGLAGGAVFIFLIFKELLNTFKNT